MRGTPRASHFIKWHGLDRHAPLQLRLHAEQLRALLLIHHLCVCAGPLGHRISSNDMGWTATPRFSCASMPCSSARCSSFTTCVYALDP